MNLKWEPEMIFLGTGGNSPGVESLKADSDETRNLIELSPGHSAYAIDIHPEDGSIAVGTRGGLIHLIADIQGQDTDKPALQQNLIHGAPILSVCWVNKSYLAVSDTSGRCLRWLPNHESLPQPLEVIEGNICCLLKLADGMLAGLSSKGKLHFWQPLSGELVRTVNLPAPPPISALFRIICWPAEHAVAFPGSGGRLILFELESEKIRVLEAHKGNFYAVSILGECLLSVGMKDCRMKIWPPGADEPLYDIEAPEGIISIGFAGISSDNLLLVDAKGTVGVYTLENDTLRLSRLLPRKDCRVIATPVPEKMQQIRAQKREDDVQRIVSEIEKNIGRASDDLIDRLHYQLIELGYEHVSLVFRANEAEQKGNFVEALRFYFLLIQILPQDNPKICTSMETYAALLQKTWHLPEASAVCKRILKVNPSYHLFEDTKKIAQFADLVKSKNCIIEPDVPIELIIESSSVIGKQLLGRYVIKSLDPEPCGRIKLNADVVEKKYNQVRRDLGDEALPAAATERIWSLSREEANEITIITFGDGATNSVKGLQFALEVLPGDLGTTVVPMVLFDWRENGKGLSIEEENEKASRTLRSIRNKAISNPYLEAIHKTLKHALQRLLTENLPPRRV